MKKAIVLLFLATLTLGAMAEKTVRGEVEFVIRIIESSSDTSAANDAADLVPEELKSLLRHDRYSEVGIAILRGSEIEFDIGGTRGDIESRIIQQGSESIIECEVEIRGPECEDDEQHAHHHTVIETTATVTDGETVVLGASKAAGGSNAMIVLLTAKIVR